MIKKLLVMILFILLIVPVNINAKSIDNTMPYIAVIDACQGGDSAMFGDINDSTSTAWLIQKVLNYIKIIGPTLAVALGSIDMVQAMILSDEEHMKKAQMKFIRRILAAVALFFIPLFTSILLGIFGLTSDTSKCGLK